MCLTFFFFLLRLYPCPLYWSIIVLKSPCCAFGIESATWKLEITKWVRINRSMVNGNTKISSQQNSKSGVPASVSSALRSFFLWMTRTSVLLNSMTMIQPLSFTSLNGKSTNRNNFSLTHAGERTPCEAPDLSRVTKGLPSPNTSLMNRSKVWKKRSC